VRAAGVKVGRVTAISTRGPTAVVGLALDSDEGPVYRDARVRVRVKTLVGESYVDVERGSPRAGAIPDGGVLPIRQARPAVELDEVLSTFDAPRRAEVRRLLRGFGDGLRDGPADLNATLEGLAATVHEGGPPLEALAAEHEHVATLVADLGVVLEGLAERKTDIRRLVRGGRTAARAFAHESASVRRGLRELPSTLTTAQRTTSHLASVGRRAAPVLDDLGAAMDDLTPAARDLSQASSATLRALRRLHGFAPRAERLLVALRRISAPTRATVPPLTDTLRQLRPLLATFAPYANDAAHFLVNSAESHRDATGGLAPVTAVFATSTYLTLPKDLKDGMDALLGAGLAKLVNLKGINQYPEPGTAAHTTPLTRYPRVDADAP
jgi:phospholipid/cholesterol/gamma-HCH transport system substrate-binding protein